jgi:uncharacterized Fe-S radical SAM superfamily protein PflX
MKNISIPATISTPIVDFNTSGRILIRGKSLPENASMFYHPLIRWVRELRTAKVNADLDLEYINSSSAKKLLEILKSIDKNLSVKEFNVNWYYDADDEDSFENGRILADLLKRARFRFYRSNGNV